MVPFQHPTLVPRQALPSLHILPSCPSSPAASHPGQACSLGFHPTPAPSHILHPPPPPCSSSPAPQHPTTLPSHMPSPQSAPIPGNHPTPDPQAPPFPTPGCPHGPCPGIFSLSTQPPNHHWPYSPPLTLSSLSLSDLLGTQIRAPMAILLQLRWPMRTAPPLTSPPCPQRTRVPSPLEAGAATAGTGPASSSPTTPLPLMAPSEKVRCPPRAPRDPLSLSPAQGREEGVGWRYLASLPAHPNPKLPPSQISLPRLPLR